MGGEKKNKVETGRRCRYGSPGKRGKVAGVKFVAVEVREDELKRIAQPSILLGRV